MMRMMRLGCVQHPRLQPQVASPRNPPAAGPHAPTGPHIDCMCSLTDVVRPGDLCPAAHAPRLYDAGGLYTHVRTAAAVAVQWRRRVVIRRHQRTRAWRRRRACVYDSSMQVEAGCSNVRARKRGLRTLSPLTCCKVVFILFTASRAAQSSCVASN